MDRGTVSIDPGELGLRGQCPNRVKAPDLDFRVDLRRDADVSIRRDTF